MKLALKLDQIRAAVPKGPTRYAQLYAVAKETKARYKRITLFTLFISEENTHLLRPHVFQKSESMTPGQWHFWLAENLTAIHKNAVLPGLAIRTNKSWAVERIIGWTGNNVMHKSDAPALDRKRHSTKRQRIKNG